MTTGLEIFGTFGIFALMYWGISSITRRRLNIELERERKWREEIVRKLDVLTMYLNNIEAHLNNIRYTKNDKK